MLNASVESSSSHFRIHAYLLRTAGIFTPPLDARVDLTLYASKLADHAVNLFVVHDGVDVAHAAFYLPVSGSDHEAFLTSFSVHKEWWGKKLAVKLMAALCDVCRKNSATTTSIRLKVSRANNAATGFYINQGFVVISSNDQTYTMRKMLENHRPDLE